MKYIAHRGAHQQFPENTLEAFQEAISLGFDGVECDVRRCHSGELIIMHDAELSRTTNGAGRVAATPYGVLKRLKVKDNFAIPTLQQVIEEILPKTWVNFDLKDADASIIGQIAQMVSPKLQGQLLISSKHLNTLSDPSTGLERAIIHPIAAVARQRARQLQLNTIVTRSWRVNRPWWVRAAQRDDINVYLYPIRSQLAANEAMASKATGIMSDLALT